MNNKYVYAVIALVFTLVVGFLTGRYFTPVETVEIVKEKTIEVINKESIKEAVEKTKIEYEKKIQEIKSKETCKIVYRTVVENKDGSKVKKEIEIEGNKETTNNTAIENKTEETSKTETETTKEEIVKYQEKEVFIYKKSYPSFSLGIGATFDPMDFQPTSFQFKAGKRIYSGFWVESFARLPIENSNGIDFKFKNMEIGIVFNLQF
jgi:hypothetical protein